MSAGESPISSALFRNFSKALNLSPDVSATPLSSMAMATTAAPYFLTRGRTSSILFSSAVQELKAGVPGAHLNPSSAEEAFLTSRSRGILTLRETSLTTSPKNPGSFSPFVPKLMSRASAPSLSWDRAASAMPSTSPASIIGLIFLLPKGFILSPIILKGNPSPKGIRVVLEAKKKKFSASPFFFTCFPLSLFAMALMCEGVVPQQPPIMEAPFS